MNVNTTPNAARGEVTVTIAGQPVALRFSLAVLHDYTTAKRCKIPQVLQDMAEDTLGTMADLLAIAVRRAGKPDFTTADALELSQELTQEQGNAMASAIWLALKIDQNPLLKALIAQAPTPAPKQQESTTGDSTSTLLTAS